MTQIHLGSMIYLFKKKKQIRIFLEVLFRNKLGIDIDK